MARILLADDDTNLRTTLEEVLQGAGHEVVPATNGEQAIEAYDGLASAETLPDIVILDCLMPKMGGFDVAKALVGRNTSAKLVFMSGVYKTSGHKEEAQGYGGKAYLMKPFEPDRLLKVIDKLSSSGGSASAGPAAKSRGSAPSESAAPTAAPKNPLPAEGGLVACPVIHLLWRAAREQHTGILDVFGDQKRGRVFVYKGRATMAQCDDPTVNLAVELIRCAALTAEMYHEVLALVAERGVGMYDVVKEEGWADDATIKTAYRELIPRAVAHIIGTVGRFRWTETNAHSRLVPAAPLDLMTALKQGLRQSDATDIAGHIEPRAPLRLAPGENWDEISAILDEACGSSSLARAINGRATIAQMLGAARNDTDKASRLKQAYLLMSTQAVIASEQVIKVAPRAEPEPTPEQAQAQAQAAQAAQAQSASFTAPPKTSSPAQAAVDQSADAGIDFTPEEQAARQKVTDKYADLKDKDYFEVLGLPDGAEGPDVKKAYFALAREFHTDAFAGLRLGSAQGVLDAVFSIIQEAYGTLSDEKKRAEFVIAKSMQAQGMSTDIGALLEAEGDFSKGKFLVERGELMAASKLFEKCTEVNPANKEWRAYHAYSAWFVRKDVNDIMSIIPELDATYKEQPALHELMYFCGHLALEAGDLKRARSFLRKCVQGDGNMVAAQRMLRTVNKRLEEGEKKDAGLMGRFLKR